MNTQHYSDNLPINQTVDLFIELDSYYLFLDESGTPNPKDTSSDVFVLCCIKIEKNYYNTAFRKEVLKFKKKHKIENLVLHSSDIRRTRKNFSFLLHPRKRQAFFNDITALIQNMDFEIYYYSVKKDEIEDGLDIYWVAMREIFLMIKNDLMETNRIEKVFCQSRNNNQNKEILASYKSYHQNLLFETENSAKTTQNSLKFQNCFPREVEFRDKKYDINEISGLEIADLVAFPIMNYIKNGLNRVKTNEKLFENYQLLRSKIKKNYHYKLHKNYKNPPLK